MTASVGRASEKAIWNARLIDRPLRPLFPEDFYNEVQVVIHTLSVNPEIDPDIPAMIGASAALAICQMSIALATAATLEKGKAAFGKVVQGLGGALGEAAPEGRSWRDWARVPAGARELGYI